MLSYPSTFIEIDTSDSALLDKVFTLLYTHAQTFQVECERAVMTKRELVVKACEIYSAFQMFAEANRFCNNERVADNWERAAGWWKSVVIDGLNA